ncbi:MAG: hypothetical protein JRM85_05005 [Nitrososphaerota archaeon]|jgi:hypothetical protein|nr:hypothetical protein [Nitrososphaerota archaeon]
MASFKKSKQYALYRLLPDYYVNDRGFVQRVVPDPNGVREIALSTSERARIDRLLRARLRGYQGDPNIAHYKFKFVEHVLVNRTLDPDVFLCPRCNTVYTLKALRNSGRNVIAFRCLNSHCKEKLKQIPFLWVHPVCGSIEQMRSSLCPQCHQKYLGLRLNGNDLSRSEWVCPDSTCGYTSRTTYPRFSQVCSNCWSQGRRQQFMMSLLPAIKVYRPQRFSSFNLSGDWRKLLGEWFGVQTKSPVLDQLPDWMKKKMEEDENYRRSVLEPFGETGEELQGLLDELGIDEKDAQSWDTVQELTDLAGLWQRRDVVGRMDADEDTSKVLSEMFKLQAWYCDGIPIMDVVFGSLIGSSDKQSAALRLIDGGTASEKLAFVRPFTTEGVLFRLEPSSVQEWLAANGHPAEGDVRRHLLGATGFDPALAGVKTLLHSMSHLLIRTSEIYSGVSRETLSEVVFPRSLSFLVYNTRGSELGMLRTTFEAQMPRWLYAARAKALKCVNDPLCARQRTPCYACMFIAERNCPDFNTDLDRDILVTTRGEWKIGFWNQS